jgi:hypothetical protein
MRRLMDSARRGELVAVIGTGVSLGLTNGAQPALSWRGLIEHGFTYGVQKARITEAQAAAWKAQRASTDLDDLLSAAEFMARKLGAPDGDLYARWLEAAFEPARPANEALQDALGALHAAGIPLCTLNYDHLLEQVTGLPSITLTEVNRVAAWVRRESSGVLHLHGCWNAPATCVLGISDYDKTLRSDVRDLFQRHLGAFRRLLFIGCGDTFADPNFGSLIRWLRQHMKTAAPEHYALVLDGDIASRHADSSWHGFVEPLAYGPGHDDLATFLLEHFARAVPAAPTREAGADRARASARHERILDDYRAFLVKDCGQMTIEGVRADMDTALRRFDLERLFVPLSLVASPPEIPEKDPQRARKLRDWQRKSTHPRAFGDVFKEHRRLALLALPGGGKSLLLKRLAVAYADPARRGASADALPDLDLVPVLIRCREWREHIHRPIPTLLQNLPDITGQAALSGLGEALLPLFKKGRVLLLVDGLDEIHDDARRATFVEHLESFAEEHEQSALVVTSREAGFSLIAPPIARFCERWRIAPLETDAITAFCDHWHRLMTGDSPDAVAEAQDVAQMLTRNASLRRLAENPLLLTMLLVVKHGAGRLPPDRVSLYGRAVDVLLDTWNIKGHAPLNPKEAVPQLAYVALELMRAGTQTATETELLALFEQARENVPQISRYAKDSPQEFLRRVELRSSLLVEAGRQADRGATVPFYQFRHLTFQEYLAAVAAVDGHYPGYAKTDTVLTPLADHLTADDWREVVPMSAVLARKSAEPLMAALVEQGSTLRRRVEAGRDFAGRQAWLALPIRLPAPVARLAQCLIEEAEATPETLVAALSLIAFFARGCGSNDDWAALSRGPYGDELRHQAWRLYAPMSWPPDTLLLNTCGTLLALRQPQTFWRGAEGKSELDTLLDSRSVAEIARGLLTCVGIIWTELSELGGFSAVARHLDAIETHLFHEDRAVWVPAAWLWTAVRERVAPPRPAPRRVMDHLLALWLADPGRYAPIISEAIIVGHKGLLRRQWAPVLTDAHLRHVRDVVTSDPRDPWAYTTSLVIAFHAGDVLPDRDLGFRLLKTMNAHALDKQAVNAMLGQLSRSRRISRRSGAASAPRRRRRRG